MSVPKSKFFGIVVAAQ